MSVGLAVIEGFLAETDFCLGDWVVQPEFGNLIRGEATIHLEPKVVEVLVCLAKRPRKLVTKGELLQTVWANTSVTEDSLKRCVRELRKAFRDNARAPSFIGTVPTRGYYLMLTPVGLPRVRSPDNGIAPAVPICSVSKTRVLMELTKIIKCQKCAKGIEVVSEIYPTDGPEIESQVTCPTCGKVNPILWPGTAGWTIFGVFPVTIH
jgi:DNA-binding winged helix-turn-helix (wHTH) protein